MAEFAWAELELSEEVYNLDWLDIVINLSSKTKILIGTRTVASGGVTVWKE